MHTTKKIFKQLLPPAFLALKRKVMGQFFKRNIHVDEHLHQAYQARNKNCALNEVCVRENLTFQVYPDSKHSFEYFCYLSPEMVQELDAFIKLSQDRFCLLDIGALHGIFSLVFAKNTMGKPRKAIAVDASPIAFAKLLYNVHKNPDCDVTAVECAISGEPGTIKMFYEWEHAVAAPANHADEINSQSILVEAKTGDMLCNEFGFIPDLIKIDVEGHEVKVFRGLSQILANYRPLIFLELHPRRIFSEGDSVNEIADMVTRYHYQIQHLDETPIGIAELKNFVSDIRLILTPV